MIEDLSSDRLAPVLIAMIAMLAGAFALELALRDRTSPPIVVAIDHGVNTTVAASMDGDDGGDDDSGAVDDDEVPVDEDHARARTLARRGDLADAIALYGSVIASHPDDGRLLGELGYWQLAADDLAGARSSLEQARVRLPDDPLIALNLGIALSRGGGAELAEAELRRALALKPGYGRAHLALGRLLRKQGRTADAIAELEIAAGSGSNDERARALVALGRAYLDADRGDDSDDAFTLAIELAPASAELRLAVAKAYLGSERDGDLRRAIDALDAAIRMAPDVPQLHAALGRARERDGDVSGAEQAYEHALRLDPAYHHARRRLLRIALDREDFPRARLHADYLLRDAGDVAEHHFLAGLVASRDDRRDDALRHYTDALARAGGTYPEAWYNIGLVEKAADHLDEAIAAYRHALDQRPDYLAALNNLGLALDDAGRADEAETAFRQAITADKTYAAAWLNLGDHYAAARRWDDAIAALREALVARPGYPRARNNLASILRKAGRVDEAIAIAESLVADDARYVSAWITLGAARADARRDDDAIAAYRRALALDPDHATARRELARLLAGAQRLDEARTTYQELLDRVPGDRAGRLGLAGVLRDLGDRAGCARDAKVVLADSPGDAEAERLVAACSP